MKKIWFMLLLVCSACAFTACSDDDNEIPLSEKITGIDMPKEIVLGEKVEIKAKGFTTTAKLALENKAQGTVELEDAKFTETMVTFTVPEDILIETYSVILTQEGEKCTLGEVKVVDKPNPIEGLEVQEKITLGDDITIKGKGFNETTEFIFANEQDTIRIKPQVNENDATFTVSIDEPAGNYTLSLLQNNWKWELKDIEIVEKITSLQMPNIINIGKEVEILGEGFKAEAFKLMLQEVNSDNEPIAVDDATFTDKGVSFIVPNDLVKNASYNIILVYGDKEWPLGVVTAIKQNKRINKITHSYVNEEDGYDGKEEWTFQYDANNRISEIVTDSEEETTTYNIEYTTSKITVSFGDNKYIYTLDGKRVAKSITEFSDEEGSVETTYIWDYTPENYLSSISDEEDPEYTIPFDYENGNLINILAYYDLVFSDPDLMNRSGNIDLVTCIYKFFLQAVDDNHQFFSFLLGISGNYSKNLPTNFGEKQNNATIEYEGENHITSISANINGGEAHKLVFEYEDYNE
ncbi:MAG: hypothetical protein K2O69_07475 [Odoribacter sp.]|nr:hypothetical protein [Odoribacter sp.]